MQLASHKESKYPDEYECGAATSSPKVFEISMDSPLVAYLEGFHPPFRCRRMRLEGSRVYCSGRQAVYMKSARKQIKRPEHDPYVTA